MKWLLLPFLLAFPLCLHALSTGEDDPSPIVARGKDLTLSTAELEPVLLDRFGLSQRGREILKLHLKVLMVERLAALDGLRVSEREIDRRWKRIDADVKASGDGRGIAGQLADQGMPAQEFRDFLRVSLLHEELARRGLKLPEDAPVSGDQQEIWLEQQMQTRGEETFPPPWSNGIVARCGEVEVDAPEYARFLRQHLPEADVLETAWHLLLLKGIERRMPDLSREATERGIEAELDRRREKHEAENPGVTFEQFLGAQGRNLAVARKDPSVAIAVLSRLWVDQTAGDEGVRAAYEKERALFEGVYGRAIYTHMLFLVASRHGNQLNPRTFGEAEEELVRMTKTVGNTEDFAELARRHSEHPPTRDEGGLLGWITSTGPRDGTQALRDAVFRDFELAGPIPAEGRRVGPISIETGSVMLWVSRFRKSPPWETMREHVHNELRRRFLTGILEQEDVELLP